MIDLQPEPNATAFGSRTAPARRGAPADGASRRTGSADTSSLVSLVSLVVSLAAALALAVPISSGAMMPAPVAGEELVDPLAPELSQRDRLGALIAQVKAAQAGIETMTADFERHQESQLLLEPETSRGRFSYQAPDRVRWEYRQPHPIDTLIEGETMVTYYADLEKAERYEIGEYSERVFEYLGARGSLETLMKYFELTADFPDSEAEAYHLTLLPRYKRVSKRLDSMELWIDGRRFLPVRLRYVLPNGDVTEFSFEDLETNTVLPEGAFQLEIPEGTEIRTVDLKGRS
ncbi:MAG: outer membrane lipoprotein carrier protein LolA [Acidobacteria bacterium]|nr:MAG: outer membrane lipoprotein carrier protein LolA [Acidobacteriota bacterium]REK12109.1 MAG: outer membrane lipoprotein carrier protein LolA [Acidobacteriota bacterium]